MRKPKSIMLYKTLAAFDNDMSCGSVASGTKPTCRLRRAMSAFEGKAENIDSH